MLRFTLKWLLRLAVAGAAVLVVILAYAAMVTRPMPAHPFTDSDEHLVIAHRGGGGLWPENTLFAFRNAIRIGADALEFDVHATSDGELVVIHDATVDRTTDGSGRVDEMTWESLRSLDAGYGWTDDGASFPFRGMGLRVPSLEDVLNALPETRMIIELKNVSETARARFSETIAKSPYPERKVLASFQSESVRYFRDNNPGIATSSTVGEVLRFWVLNSLGLGFAFVPGGETMQVPPRSLNLPLVTQGFVSGAHRHNVDIYVWTINREEDMRKHVTQGADGIMTDYPDRLLQVLGRGPDPGETDTGGGEESSP